MVAFLVFAALMLFLDGRQSAQSAAASATATEMQMLSQRLARGTALASQGQAAAFPAVKDSRERFKADLEALLTGGTVRGVSLDVSQDDQTVKLLNDVKQRWERVDVAADRLLANETSLTTLAKGLESLNTGNSAILELAQQAAQQIGQGGGSCARSITRTSSPCCRSGSQRMRIRSRLPTKSTRKSPSCSARIPARSATSWADC
jgi:twitching motility protein PilJ